MPYIVDVIDRLGGVASRRELVRNGLLPDWIDIAMQRRRVERVRKGWYASLDLPVDVYSAWRVGGRLSCVSAANLHGLALPSDGRLHVNVAKGAAQLREPGSQKKRLDVAARTDVIVHWVDTKTMSELQASERVSVTLDEAIEQIWKCPHATTAAAELRRRVAGMPRAGRADSL